jgi:hypothetical protein
MDGPDHLSAAAKAAWNAHMNAPELAVSAIHAVALEWTTATPAERERHWFRLHGDTDLAAWLAPLQPTHVHFGSEFCEHLLPSTRSLHQALRQAEQAGLCLALLTPLASPDVLAHLARLLPMLPAGAEVVVNDWGVAHELATRFPALRPVAGRVLCRMTKDPRLDARWAGRCGHGLEAPAMRGLFERLGIRRLEIDMPVFAEDEALDDLPLPAGVHLPYVYVAKGRMCRAGSLSMTGPERFAVGRRCQKECLRLSAVAERPGRGDACATVQVGNTLFSRHSDAMARVLRHAVGRGRVARLVVPGEPL